MVWDDDASCWVYVSSTGPTARREDWPLDENGDAGSDRDVADDGVPVAGVCGRNAHQGAGSAMRVGQGLDDPRCLFLRHLEALAAIVHRVRRWTDRLMIRHQSSP